MAFVPAQKPGDRHPKIPAAKELLDNFSYGKGLGPKPYSDEYTVEFGIALRQWQANIHYQVVFKGRPGPDVNLLGVFDWAVQKQMGLLEPAAAPVLPWIITVGGHVGTWDTGPAYWAALPLQQQGKAVVQGVGYDAASIPFNNRSGFDEVDRIVHSVKPPNVPWAIGSHSQGAIITSDYLQQRVLPNQGDPAYANFRGGVQFGNPRRPKGVAAPWIADPPPPGSEGLADDCLPAKLPGVEECARKADLYADKTPGPDAEWKTAIYMIVARAEIFGHDSITEQLLELGVEPYTELWPIFQAITGGIQFAVNMDPHNIFDLLPPQNHLARVLGV